MIFSSETPRPYRAHHYRDCDAYHAAERFAGTTSARVPWSADNHTFIATQIQHALDFFALPVEEG
jgi:hypothetical protein